jgi:hypothetical protein
MGHRKGEFFGGFMPAELKKKLAEMARSEHRTLTQEVVRRLTISVYGTPVPFEEVGQQGKRDEAS